MRSLLAIVIASNIVAKVHNAPNPKRLYLFIRMAVGTFSANNRQKWLSLSLRFQLPPFTEREGLE